MVKKHAIDIKWHDRQQETIAQGCLTNSKHPDRFVKGIYPNMVERCKGAYFTSTKGQDYLDYVCGLGSCLLGYQQRDVAKAIVNEIYRGYSCSLPIKTEVYAAEMLKELIPFVERAKFLKTGTEAAMASIRIARAYTGRKIVLSRGYHGWSDEFTSLTPPAAGCASHPFMKKLVEIDQINDMVAAVIIEPIELDQSRDRIMWLQRLKEKCEKTGTVLIFDEIITGFRYKDWCVSNYYNIRPDLILLGKAIANGLPLSIVGGRRELMNNDQYFVSSTFAGENLSLAAFMKVVELLSSEFNINELWENGQMFLDKFNSIWPEKIYLAGYPTRAVFKGDDHIKAVFWQQAVLMGVFFGPSWFYMFPHIEHQYRVLENITDLLNMMKMNLPVLRGAPPTSPFSTKQRS
jgi:glutamate-1-semialdehyde aminotransferase